MSEAAELKARKQRIQENQKSNADAVNRMQVTADALRDASPELTEWNESQIRQLVESVTVLSKDRIKVTLRGGAEMEQEITY